MSDQLALAGLKMLCEGYRLWAEKIQRDLTEALAADVGRFLGELYLAGKLPVPE